MWKCRFGQAFVTYLTILDPVVDLGCGVSVVVVDVLPMELRLKDALSHVWVANLPKCLDKEKVC